MPKTTTVRKDLIPYEAGVVIITPLDANKKPDYTKAVATKRDFLTSTQTSVTRTTETLANGNGSDKDFIVDERYTLAVTGNTFNPEFHAAVTGRFTSEPTAPLIAYEFEHNIPLNAETAQITFGAEDGDVDVTPAADADGVFNFIVEDSYGNTLTRVDATPNAGEYQFDDTTDALIFADTMKGANIRVITFIAASGGYQVDNNPVLSQPEFQIQTFGITMSAGSDEKYRVMTTIKRASPTGDLSEQATQKAKSAPVTYNFQSNPVPTGVSVYSQLFVPMTANA